MVIDKIYFIIVHSVRCSIWTGITNQSFDGASVFLKYKQRQNMFMTLRQKRKLDIILVNPHFMYKYSSMGFLRYIYQVVTIINYNKHQGSFNYPDSFMDKCSLPYTKPFNYRLNTYLNHRLMIFGRKTKPINNLVLSSFPKTRVIETHVEV